MKHKIILAVAIFIIATTNICQGAFPINQIETINITAQQSESIETIKIVQTENSLQNQNKEFGGEKEKKSNERNKVVAILLWFFLGAIGIHRLYLGYTTIGLIQMFTLCGLGIWWLIDGFRLLTGSLRPAKGKKWSDKI
jgi:TM2 domain